MPGPRLGWQKRLEMCRREPDECWIWPGCHTPQGYRYTSFDGRFIPAHRAIYEHLVGAIPCGLHLDHLCRNPGCVNPAHLEPVTCRTNILRGTGVSAINAAKTRCKNGHDLTSPDSYWLKKYHKRCTQRICKACKREANMLDGRRRRAARSAARTHCNAGHALTPENIYTRRDGKRFCRTCFYERQRRANALSVQKAKQTA